MNRMGIKASTIKTFFAQQPHGVKEYCVFFNRGRAVKIENINRVPLTGGGDRIAILTGNNRTKVAGRIKYLPRFTA